MPKYETQNTFYWITWELNTLTQSGNEYNTVLSFLKRLVFSKILQMGGYGYLIMGRGWVVNKWGSFDPLANYGVFLFGRRPQSAASFVHALNCLFLSRVCLGLFHTETVPWERFIWCMGKTLGHGEVVKYLEYMSSSRRRFSTN